MLCAGRQPARGPPAGASGADHPHGAIFRDADGLAARHIALDHVPDRRPLGAFVHARPAGDRVVPGGIDRLAALEVGHHADAAARRLALPP